MSKKTASDYRIEEVRLIALNGKEVKSFKAYERKGDAFIFCGDYTAPKRTVNKNLWLIPENAESPIDD